MSRGLCCYIHVDLGRIHAAERDTALALEIGRLSPYANTGHIVAWCREGAMVWVWDQDAVGAKTAEVGLDVRRLRVIPEEMLIAPIDYGFRILALEDGYLGQAWGDGVLLDSRWWPNAPGPDRWLAFERGRGVPPEAQSAIGPEPLVPVLLERPWCRTSRGPLARGDAERLAVVAGAVVLSALAGWYGAQWYALDGLVQSAAAEVAQLEAESSQVLKAQRAATAALERLRVLTGLRPYPDQLQLMARVAESLPSNGAHLSRWSFERGQLDLTVAAPAALSSSFLVEALQRQNELVEVQTEPGTETNAVNLRMKVRPL